MNQTESHLFKLTSLIFKSALGNAYYQQFAPLLGHLDIDNLAKVWGESDLAKSVLGTSTEEQARSLTQHLGLDPNNTLDSESDDYIAYQFFLSNLTAGRSVGEVAMEAIRYLEKDDLPDKFSNAKNFLESLSDLSYKYSVELGYGNEDVTSLQTVFDGRFVGPQTVESILARISGQEFENVKASVVPISYTSSAEVIEGTAGSDSINAGLGDDTVNGGEGSDIIIGGAGNDSLYGEQGQDWIEGGEGDDIIQGGYGYDTLYGGEGVDRVFGGTGNDKLYGGAGQDSLEGGDGADVLYGDEDNDSLNGGEGQDSLDGGNGDDVLYGNEGNDSLNGGEGKDSLYGNEGNDTLDGGEGQDLLEGGGGDDSLEGGDGDDQLNGGGGDDQLSGGDGDDQLNGGDGNDKLFGGNGNNLLIGGSGNDSTWGNKGTKTVYGGTGDDYISFIGNYRGVVLYDGDEDVAYGEEGDDRLTGFGQDKLDGGEGDDTIYLIRNTNSADSSVIRAGEGSDFISISTSFRGYDTCSSVMIDLTEEIAVKDTISIGLVDSPNSSIDIQGFDLSLDKLSLSYGFEFFSAVIPDSDDAMQKYVDGELTENYVQIVNSTETEWQERSDTPSAPDEFGKGYFVIQDAIANSSSTEDVAALIDGYGNNATYDKLYEQIFIVNVNATDLGIYHFKDDTGLDNQIVAEELTTIAILTGVTTEEINYDNASFIIA